MLQERGIYFDDLVVDVGRVRESQMRQWPYVIVTIPRLNAQVAVSNQRGQAVFVAQPAIDVMDWAIFSKQQAGVPGTAFSHVKRIVCLGAWQSKMLDWVIGAAQAAGAKVSLPGFVRAHRSGAYTLSEGIIVEMAKMYRERHPERQWPSQNSGDVDQDIIEAVTGDADWQAESWANINTAAVQNLRGLKSAVSLPKLLKRHGWGYDLSEEMIVKMANLWRLRAADRQWPSLTSGEIPHDIVVEVTGDALWQKETWQKIDSACKRSGRGMTRKVSLAQLLRDHGCHYDLTEEVVLKMARLWREQHPERQWPSCQSGFIPTEIVSAATGREDWRPESWNKLEWTFRKPTRGLKGPTTLSRFLFSNGCHYDQLSEEKIVELALRWREQHPQRRLPDREAGIIPHQIVAQVFKDPFWQPESWVNIDAVCRIGGRGLREKTTLKKLWDKYLPSSALSAASATARGPNGP